ncbi:MAG: proprotein convertase P-domain-containing protein [Nannocystaceae bacterium]
MLQLPPGQVTARGTVDRCIGAPEAWGVGRCPQLPGFGEQTECTASAPCDLGQGLVYAMLTRGDEGQCFPAWMRGNFGEAALDLPIPSGGEGLARATTVYGLATVDTDVELDLRVDHPDASSLRVTLINPAGNEVVVFAGESEQLDLDRAVPGFSGGEMINGPWTLRVGDDASGDLGRLAHWTLRLGSRWD